MKVVLKLFILLSVFCASVVNVFSLDREAFSIRNYDLNLQVDPEQHRLGVRGVITLRNDSGSAQKIAVLQISSSLDWRAVKAGDKPLQFVTQPYASDIDHTGALSEAIVTLPQAVDPHGSIDLTVAYEGVILLDATRLTRIGTPEDVAQSTDWDQIGPEFSAVRGAGYVAWYPIATEVANLSESNTLFEVLARWKEREAGVGMQVTFNEPKSNPDADAPSILCSGAPFIANAAADRSVGKCAYSSIAASAPTFAMANFRTVERHSSAIFYLRVHETGANAYADAAENVLPMISDWFGAPHAKVAVADLADTKAAPFESGALLFTPLANSDLKLDGLSAAHQATHIAFHSFRPWIEEGLAHFAQALYLEQEKNRQAALDYMAFHRSAFAEAESRTSAPTSEDVSRNSLINTTSDELYRSKAMYVWWMLRDMIGDAALKKAIGAYRPEQDKEASYMPRLIAAQTQRDLEWFFDDWVYRDRGLPDFKIDSAFARKTLTNGFMVTITINNLGAAGAEVPVIVKFDGGQSAKRLEVRAKDKATIRVEVPAAPTEIVVNDGSVPESELGNNVYKVEVSDK